MAMTEEERLRLFREANGYSTPVPDRTNANFQSSSSLRPEPLVLDGTSRATKSVDTYTPRTPAGQNDSASEIQDRLIAFRNRGSAGNGTKTDGFISKENYDRYFNDPNLGGGPRVGPRKTLDDLPYYDEQIGRPSHGRDIKSALQEAGGEIGDTARMLWEGARILWDREAASKSSVEEQRRIMAGLGLDVPITQEEMSTGRVRPPKKVTKEQVQKAVEAKAQESSVPPRDYLGGPMHGPDYQPPDDKTNGPRQASQADLTQSFREWLDRSGQALKGVPSLPSGREQESSYSNREKYGSGQAAVQAWMQEQAPATRERFSELLTQYKKERTASDAPVGSTTVAEGGDTGLNDVRERLEGMLNRSVQAPAIYQQQLGVHTENEIRKEFGSRRRLEAEKQRAGRDSGKIDALNERLLAVMERAKRRATADTNPLGESGNNALIKEIGGLATQADQGNIARLEEEGRMRRGDVVDQTTRRGQDVDVLQQEIADMNANQRHFFTEENRRDIAEIAAGVEAGKKLDAAKSARVKSVAAAERAGIAVDFGEDTTSARIVGDWFERNHNDAKSLAVYQLLDDAIRSTGDGQFFSKDLTDPKVLKRYNEMRKAFIRSGAPIPTDGSLPKDMKDFLEFYLGSKER